MGYQQLWMLEAALKESQDEKFGDDPFFSLF
jgi:hypothetical protein